MHACQLKYNWRARHAAANWLKAAEEVKDAWYNKRAIIPAGTLVPVAPAFETYTARWERVATRRT